MNQADPLYESLPSTSLDSKPGTCPRCGFQASPQDDTCPRCAAPLAGSGQPVASDDGKQVQYVEQALGCMPEELEDLARREAVDGWELVDTTVDPSHPDRLLAHFRKAAPPESRGERSRRAAQRRDKPPSRERREKPKAKKAAPVPAAPAARPKPAPRPKSTKKPKRPSDERVYWTVLLLSATILLNAMGWPGLFATAFVVPGAARMISRLPRKELLALGVSTAFIVANLGWPGLFVGLWVLPGIIRSIFEDR